MKFCINSVVVRVEFGFFLMIAFSLVAENYDILYLLLFSALHELGHILSLYLFGGRADSVVVSYYGIGLRHRCNLPLLSEFLFFASGVVVNAIFCLFDIRRDINSALLFINILPVYPLDGGRMLKLLLNAVFGLYLSDRIFVAIGIITLCVMIAIAVLLHNVSLMLIVIYTVVFAVNNTFE